MRYLGLYVWRQVDRHIMGLSRRPKVGLTTSNIVHLAPQLNETVETDAVGTTQRSTEFTLAAGTRLPQSRGTMLWGGPMALVIQYAEEPQPLCNP